MPEALARRIADGTAFIERGEGEPLLLIHGVGLNAEAWRPQIETFSSTHRVIAIDMLGHGQTQVAPGVPSLEDYVAQAKRLLDALGIERTNVVGHSMGGMVALGLALAHPDRVLRVGVLNTVYQREPQARSAVEARAVSIALHGGGDVELPLDRWFGSDYPHVRGLVRDMLTTANLPGYAAAYRVFATSDRAFSGSLQQLSMPALFATGDGDPNSTPAMSAAMAMAAPRGKSAVLKNQRHMMNLTDPQATNRLLQALFAEPTAAFDPRSLRNAFGSFMTGVTVVTTIDETGTPRGFTANSFTSVSLDPPLLLVCIGKMAASSQTFSKAPGFAVNILSEKQKAVSGAFASKRPDKFTEVGWRKSSAGHPLLDGAAAWFDCARHDIIDAGDHIILMGAVREFDHSDANPLGYARGGYVTLGLEQAAVNAASVGRTVVGAILECEGMLLLTRDKTSNAWKLPEVGQNGQHGSASLLQERLRHDGIDASLGFLFAVFENPQTKVQSIYYRGDATIHGASTYQAFHFDAIPWDDLSDEALRTMLRRYAVERLEGRFKIYSGDHERGEVRALQ